MKKVYAICGPKNSGKSTLAMYIAQKTNAIPLSFAAPLKDAAALLFNYDREAVEGATDESREWREKKDEAWSESLGYDITPRYVLQRFGDILKEFHKDFWAIKLVNSALTSPNDTYVIADMRFPNELELLKKHFDVVSIKITGYPVYDTHCSETSWQGIPCEYEIAYGNLQDEYRKVDDILLRQMV